MQTTLEEIRSHGPCQPGWKLLTKTLGRKTGPVTLKEIYESNGYNDAVWCLRCFPFESYRPWLVEVVEAVLPAFEKMFPGDKRLGQAIEAIKNRASEAELKAAADVARAVAYAAHAATRTAFATRAAFATRTAFAASEAARAITYAAFAASEGARATVFAAFSASDVAAFSVTDAAAATRPETVEAIFIKHFCN